MALSAGTTLGPYEILAPIGTGGMGEVYRARDTKLKRDVALKVLPDSFACDPERMARFQREAEVLASLNHPNIAAIYGVEDGALVMELVEGPTLGERIKRGLIALEEALPIAKQIAEALEYAHEKGIIHRDLKPANVKLTVDGNVKVLDFGLAKVLEQPVAAGNPSNATTVPLEGTRAGVILGTAAYMAPEQARGQPVDKRTDVWAFGVVLYEMLTGKRLFDGESMSDVLAAVLKSEIDWSLLPKPTPASVRRLLLRCLERDRKKRLRDLGDAWMESDDPVPAGQKKPLLPWALSAAMTLVAAIALWAPWHTPQTAADRPLQVDVDAGPDQVAQPAISPDGMQIVFVSAGKGGSHLSVRRLDQNKVTPLAGTAGATYPFFSPDGQWVAFFANGKLQKVALKGGAPVTLCDGSNPRGGSWGEDGNIIVALNTSGGLSQVPSAGGAPQPFTDLKGEAGVISHRWPQVLPGGRGVLFAATESLKGSLRVLPSAGGKPKTLVQNCTYGRYLPGGQLVFHQRGTLFAAPLDLGRLELTGPAVPLVDGVAYDPRVARAEFDLSSSGTLVYRRGNAEANRVVSWLDSSGKTEPMLAKVGSYTMPRLSPDGKRLALSMTQDDKRDIWVYDRTRDTMTRLTFGAEDQFLPVWTPDGDFIAFYSGGTLAWMRVDGRGQVELLSGLSRGAVPYSFSPNGKRLAFYQPDAQTGFDLWTVPVERTPSALRVGQPQVLLRHAGNQTGPTFSPDGRWLAYESDESGRIEAYVMRLSETGPAAAAKWQVSNGGGLTPVWSRNARELFFVGPERRIMVARYSIERNLFAADKPHVWCEKQLADTGGFSSFDVAPDGKRVVAVLDAEGGEYKPETMLRVLLNVNEELRRHLSAVK